MVAVGSVDFRVLGPFEVVRGPDRIDVGGPAQRRVLTALLTSPGEVVRLDSLIDAVWGDQVPSTATRTLQASLSRLRRCIPPATIERAGGGYRLHTEPSSVDWQVLSEAVAGDDRAAVRAALALWRERPFPELVDWEPAAALISRLVELRISGLERVFREELRRPDPATLLPELEALVTEEPLREGLWELLVDALRLAGRRADALAAYDRAQAVIRGELGVDPSSRLAAARQRALDERDVIGTLPGVGHHLPAQRTSFVSRDSDFERLRTALGRGRLVTVTGIGGVGKTRLATVAAAELADEYADGVFMVELAGLGDGSLVGGRIASALGLGGADASTSLELEQELASWLGGRKVLVVIDNCEHLIDDVADVVDAIMEGSTWCTVLATSREPLELPDERIIALGGLDVESGIQLLWERATPATTRDGEDAGRVPERDLAAQVVSALDGIPLAIELAAAQLDHLSLEQLLDRLSDRFRLLTGGRRRGRQRQQTLTAMMDWSWSLLDDAEQMLLAQLSVFANGWTLDSACAVCDGPQLSIVEGIRALRAKSLVTTESRSGQYRFGMLETVRLYAATRLIDFEAARATRDRHLSWIGGLVRDVRDGIQTDDELAWVERVDDEIDNIVVAGMWALESADYNAVFDLLDCMWVECLTRSRPDLGPVGLELVQTLHDQGDPRLPEAIAACHSVGQAAPGIDLGSLVDQFGPVDWEALCAAAPAARPTAAMYRAHWESAPDLAAQTLEPFVEHLKSLGLNGQAARIRALVSAYQFVAQLEIAGVTAQQALEEAERYCGPGSLATVRTYAQHSNPTADHCRETSRLARGVRADYVMLSCQAHVALLDSANTDIADHDARASVVEGLALLERSLGGETRWNLLDMCTTALARRQAYTGVVEAWGAIDALGFEPIHRSHLGHSFRELQAQVRHTIGELEYARRHEHGSHLRFLDVLTLVASQSP